MNYSFSIFFLTFFYSFSFSQLELVLETDHNKSLNDFFYSTQTNLNGEVQFTNEKMFLRLGGRELAYIDEENKSLQTVVTFSDSVISKQLNTFDHGIYFVAYDGYNKGAFKLYMVDNDLGVHEFSTHEYTMVISQESSGFFIQRVGKNIIFYLRDNDRKRFFKFDTETKQTEQIIDYSKFFDLTIHSANNEGVLYSQVIGGKTGLYYLDKDTEINTLESENQEINKISWVESNDTSSFYVSYNYANNIDSVFRYDNETLEKFFFSTSSLTRLNFNGNRVLGNSGGFLGVIQSDTLTTLQKPIQMVSQYTSSPASSFYGSRLLNEDLELFTYPTSDLGFELFKINNQDSIDLFMDLNIGRGHGIPVGGCQQINTPPNRIVEHDGEIYYNMTNGNDPNVYLYKVTNDSLESVLKLKDYNPNRIRYFTFKDYLYYFVFHSESGKNRLYRVRWDQMNDKQPQEIKFKSETWATETSTMGLNQLCQSQSGNYITPNKIHHDNDNNIYINHSFRNYWNNYLGFERRNKFYFTDSLSNTFIKYTPYGELKWVKNIGEKYKSIFAKPDKLIIDNENNLQVYGVFHKKAFFDNDSLVTVGSARYYTKLDGETGAVLEKKVLYQTDYIDDVRFDQLIKGEENYFYLAGSYRNFNQNFGDTTLISPWNFQNFLAKYDDNGNLVWIRNVLNNWNDVIGEINNIEYMEENDEIVVFSSQNLTWCNDGTWMAEIIFYDTHGKEKTRKEFRGYNRHTKGKVTSLDKRYFLVKGSINEAISAGVYEFSNQNDIECTNTYDYQIIYDRSQNKFISASISDSLSAINIKRVIKEHDYIYYLGNRVNGGNIVIQRFLNDGTYEGEKVLNQSVDLRLFDISYQDGFFVLAMQDAEPDNFLNINPIFKEAQNVLNIARFQITDWDYLQSYSPMDVQFVEEASSLFAYPNPAIDVVQINFTNENNIFKNYRVVNLSGQILFQDDVPDQNFVQIDLSSYENGLYFVQFEGAGKREIVKVIKQP